MKRAVLLCILTSAPFLFAQTDTCPEQPYPAIPAGVDATKIAFDHDGSNPYRPAPKRLFLTMFVLALGQTAVHEGYGCDEDGDRLSFSYTKGQIDVNDADYTYTWSYTPAAPGIEYVNLTLTDIVATDDPLTQADDPMPVTGTFVVKTVRANRPPVLCGGRP